MPPSQAQASESIKYEEEYTFSSRRISLFTCRWLPANNDPKALIFLCHGYAMECSISMKGTGIKLAEAGYEVHGMDYEGHGKSSGLQGYIQSFDDVVSDCFEHFKYICERKRNRKKKRFLLGESMGGVVAIKLHMKKPTYWHGAILVAPMCKIDEEMRPSPAVVNVLGKLCKYIPTWKIVPTDDIVGRAIKNPEWRKVVRNNPYCYKGKPRLKTGQELMNASLEVEKVLDQVSLPFIVVHGGDDVVTDPKVSQALYETAQSRDKTLKLYPGMWHALTSGEPQENIDLVFSDIIAWLDERSMWTDSRLSEEEQHADRNDLMMIPMMQRKED